MAGAELGSNAIYLNRQRAEDFVMGMVSKVVLEEGHLERYYQQCLEQHNQSQGSGIKN